MKQVIIKTLNANIGNYTQVSGADNKFKGAGDLLSFETKRKSIKLHFHNGVDQYFVTFFLNKNDVLRVGNQPLKERMEDFNAKMFGKTIFEKATFEEE